MEVFVDKYRAKVFVVLCLIAIMLLYLYICVIQPENKYLGMQPYMFGSDNFIILIFGLLISTIAFPRVIGEVPLPSDFFRLIYIIMVLFPNIVLWQITGFITLLGEIGLVSILALPLFFVIIASYLTNKKNIKTKRVYFFGGRKYFFIGIVVFICIPTILFYGHQLFSLSFVDSYTRRIEARAIFFTGSLQGYILSVSINGIAPMLGFMASKYRRWELLALAIILSFIGYAIIGVKASLQYVFILMLSGYFLNKISSKKFFYFILIGILILFILASINLLVFDNVVLIDILIRRAFAVPAQLQACYYDYIFNLNHFSWFASSSEPISFTVGYFYTHDINTNANTNTFLYFLGQYGFGGYIINILLICLFFTTLDSLYKQFLDSGFIGVSIICSLLVIEQSFTTVLVSSGIIFLLIVCYFTKET